MPARSRPSSIPPIPLQRLPTRTPPGPASASLDVEFDQATDEPVGREESEEGEDHVRHHGRTPVLALGQVAGTRRTWRYERVAWL